MTAFRFRSSIVAIFVSLTAAFALQQVPSDPPKPFTGKVVSISDGDTVTVLLDRTQHKIRLEHIDAPESGQAFGTKARKALGDLVFGKEVKVEWTGRDKYKRILGVIYVEDRNIDLEIVKEGLAWHFTKYSKEPKYAEAKKAAKEAKCGLWADAKPVAPWDYRRNQGLEDPDVIDPETFTVVVTPKGKKYHRVGCSTLSNSTKATNITLKEAGTRLEPCAKCRPPVVPKSESK
jgi:micrococcal nuclease